MYQFITSDCCIAQHQQLHTGVRLEEIKAEARRWREQAMFPRKQAAPGTRTFSDAARVNIQACVDPTDVHLISELHKETLTPHS